MLWIDTQTPNFLVQIISKGKRIVQQQNRSLSSFSVFTRNSLLLIITKIVDLHTVLRAKQYIILLNFKMKILFTVFTKYSKILLPLGIYCWSYLSIKMLTDSYSVGGNVLGRCTVVNSPPRSYFQELTFYILHSCNHNIYHIF